LYTEVTVLQLASGLWPQSAQTVLFAFFSPDVQRNRKINEVFLALLALCILENKFADKKAEWQLIAEKARRALKGQTSKSVDQEIDALSDYLI
jgi:hypothetical protein